MGSSYQPWVLARLGGAALALVLGATSVGARVWTNAEGRKVEAEYVA